MMQYIKLTNVVAHTYNGGTNEGNGASKQPWSGSNFELVG